MRASAAIGSTRPRLTSPAQPTTATCVRPAASVLVERGLEAIEVDRAVPVERDLAQAASAEAEDAERAADDVMRLACEQ